MKSGVLKKFPVLILLLLCFLGSEAQSSDDIKLSNSYYQSGVSNFEKKEYEEAILNYDLSIKYNASNVRAYCGKADALRLLKKFNDAITWYDKAIEMKANDTLSYVGRADAKRINRQYAEALKDCNIVLSWDPNNFRMLYARGSCYYNLREYQKSILDYDLCLKLKPTRADTYLRRSFPLIDSKQYLKAKADIKQYLRLGGEALDGVYYYLAECDVHLAEKDITLADSAILYLSKYLQSENVANRLGDKPYRMMGIAYSLKNNIELSRENFRKAVDLGPKDSENVIRWAIAEYFFKDYAKADELGGRTLSLVENPSADLYNFIAVVKVNLKDTAQSMTFFSKALQKDSSRRDIYENRAMVLFENNRYYKTVLSDIDHLIGMEEDDQKRAEFYSMKSMIGIRVGDLARAKNDVERAIDIMPNEPVHYLIRALLNASLNKDEKIILEDVEKSIKIDPTNTEAYLFKAIYLTRQGDFKNGCETLKFGIKIGGEVTKDVKNYICGHKLPKDGKIPSLSIPLNPRLIITKEPYEYEGN